MRLAVKLGVYNVDDMLANMQANEFIEWQRFYALEPFGARFEELHLAALRCQISNYLRAKNQPAINITEFMMSAVQKQQTPKQSISEAFKILSSLK